MQRQTTTIQKPRSTDRASAPLTRMAAWMRLNTKPIRAIVLLIGLLGMASVASAQSYTISPSPFLTALDNSGHIINGGCVWTYVAGTTTAATTYADTMGTPNSNPIRSDSAGRFTAFLVAGQSYKFVYESACTPPSHGTTLRTADNIAGVPAAAATVDVTGTAGETISAGQCAYLSDGSGGKAAGQWYKCDNTNTYSSTTPLVGIAPSAIASAAAGTIRIAGEVTGLATLVGATYYVGTAGAITTVAPTNYRPIGQADTASSLVVASAPGPVVAGNGIAVAGTTVKAKSYVLCQTHQAATLVSNSSTTVGATCAVPSGTLGSTGALRITVTGEFLNNSGVAASFQPQITFGGTTVVGSAAAVAAAASSATPYQVNLRATISANNLTNSQRGVASIEVGNTGAVDASWRAFLVAEAAGNNTLAVDTTTSQNLIFQLTWGATNASLSFTVYNVTVEVLQP